MSGLISGEQSITTAKGVKDNFLEAVASNSLTVKASDYDYVGQEHNRLLDLFLADYQKAMATSTGAVVSKQLGLVSAPVKQTPQEVLQKTNTNVNNSLQTAFFKQIANVTDEASRKLIIDNTNKVMDGANNGMSQTVLNKEVKTQLSPAAITVFGKLDVLLSDTDFDIISLTNRIKALESEVALLANNPKSGITKKDLNALYSGLSVAKASLTYWNANASKWKTIIQKPFVDSSLSTGSSSDASGQGSDCPDPGKPGYDPYCATRKKAIEVAKKTAVADVAGGVAVAGATAWANVVPGAGQAFSGTSIVGGAFGTSLGYLIGEAVSTCIFAIPNPKALKPFPYYKEINTPPSKPKN